jgi:threonine 3-dehydrogenase
VITDVNQYRLDLIKKILPRVITINVDKESISRDMMKSVGIFEGFDVGLEMSGSPKAFSGMLSLMINGGHIAMLAIMPAGSGIDWDMVVFKGLTIKGIYGREIFETWYKGTMMVQSGLPLEKMITHRFPYTEFKEGFDIMRSGKSGKIILNWEN